MNWAKEKINKTDGKVIIGVIDSKKKRNKIRGLHSLLDRLNFLHVLFFWTGILVIFGLLYYTLSTSTGFLMYTSTEERVKGLFDHIYFSFITATSTGFGDIIPVGYLKILSIIEVVFGLVLLAFVTSKLVSIKQDVIMNEIYEISFNEKINRLRSSLLLFRQNLGRVINNIESNSFRKREISDIYNYLSSLEDSLNEISDLLERDPTDGFTKVLDPLNTELIFNSITQSYERLLELISLMNNNKIEWRRSITIEIIDRCMVINDQLFEKLHKHKSISEKDFTDLLLQNKRIIELLRGCLGKDEKICVFTLDKEGEMQNGDKD